MPIVTVICKSDGPEITPLNLYEYNIREHAFHLNSNKGSETFLRLKVTSPGAFDKFVEAGGPGLKATRFIAHGKRIGIRFKLWQSVDRQDPLIGVTSAAALTTGVTAALTLAGLALKVPVFEIRDIGGGVQPDKYIFIGDHNREEYNFGDQLLEAIRAKIVPSRASVSDLLGAAGDIASMVKGIMS